ncbi:MAG TPA: ATP-binding cassette domain-containing protein [Niabella sp.]|nr:ATP-binding cassette domain-containing protein [Niabella sp.]HOZ96216.1 ATP-binding cassette domain-containing protein [Niabella sp.]HQW13581.1 ATP-binding cassette domain-containing protein [Niabella sp.]HQX18975.1 ATP-binding cassette domain-containing protein [Niabella sp.]HQX40480.1 ATP-binding cassette domain-containing protein [Niabella sp.]
MKIQLDNAGKRFNRDWIFRHLSYTFQSGNGYAVTGSNGSGKSTLLQLLGGAISINEGSCSHFINNNPLAPDKIFASISFCAPYLELIEELTLIEFLNFHQSFKPFINGLSIDFIAKEIQLEDARHKKIGDYSSGMKQRVKLAQSIFSNTPTILLDEPCTNLDTAGIQLYLELIEKYCADRLVIVSSNDTTEYGFCNHVLCISDFKTI